MTNYIGSNAFVAQVDGYNRAEADDQFVDVTGDTVTGSLTVEQDFTVDTDTLYVDSANNLVGIGTSSPGAKLDIGRASSTDQIQAILARQASPGDSTFNLVAKTGSGTGQNSEFFKLGIEYGSFNPNAYINFFRGNTQTGGIITFSTNNDAERMRIDSSGRVTMPYQPAFLAVNQSDTFTPNSGIFTNVYTTAKLNRGNHYNTANGAFTAPVSGVYYFLHQMSARTSSNATYEVKINVNGAELSRAFSNGGGFGHANFAMLTIALSAGDYVQAGMFRSEEMVFSGSNDIVSGSNGIVSGWTGWLLG